MALPGPGDLNFEIKQGAYSSSLDARIGEEGVFQSGVLRGINVLSRAQVYYHRPGAWQEPPNFSIPIGARTSHPRTRRSTGSPPSSASAEISRRSLPDNVWMH